MEITEDFLHYLWKFRLYDHVGLQTTEGESLMVLHPGEHNHHAGPDFLQAKIKIGDQTWVGNVEIHLRTKDWQQHGHTDYPHYKNVILHVVFHHNGEVHHNQELDMPVLELAPYIPQDQWESYQRWMSSRTWIPCQTEISRIDGLTWMDWKTALTPERLSVKAKKVMQIHAETNGNWSEVFYRILARVFGFKVNADAMQSLAESLPMQILAKHKSDPFQIEALLFGQAGMLETEFSDEYPADLKKEYLFLRSKYLLQPIGPASWNFFRLRPSNFPSIRIAQFADLIHGSTHLFSAILEESDPIKIRSLFSCKAHEYWQSHSQFDKSLAPDPDNPGKFSVERQLGKGSIDHILINAVVPVLFAYGEYKGLEVIKERSLTLLDACSAEQNTIIGKWKSLGVGVTNASDSQALLQLYNAYCTNKRCLDCRVGVKLLRSV